MRQTCFLPLSLIVGLGACGQTYRVAGENPTAPSLTQQPPTETPSALEGVLSLSGDWRVAGIDGSSLDEPSGLALRGDDSRLWWEPSCAGMARRYKIVGPSIAFESLQPPRSPGSPTPPVCAIGLPPRLDEVFVALDLATTVERTPSNGIQITGGGHSVTLFSQ